MRFLILFFVCSLSVLADPGFIPITRKENNPLRQPLGNTPGIFMIHAMPINELDPERPPVPTDGTAFLIEVDKQRFLVTAMNRVFLDEVRQRDNETLVRAFQAAGGAVDKIRANYVRSYTNRRSGRFIFRLTTPPTRGFPLNTEDKGRHQELQTFLTPPLLELIDIPTLRRRHDANPKVQLQGNADYNMLGFATDIAVFRIADAKLLANYRPLRIAAAPPKRGEEFYLLGYPDPVQSSAGKLVRALPAEGLYFSRGTHLEPQNVVTISGLRDDERPPAVRAANERGLVFSNLDADYRSRGGPIVNRDGEVFAVMVDARYTLFRNRTVVAGPADFQYPEFVIGADLRKFWSFLESAAKIR